MADGSLSPELLSGVGLRVWAEIGRARMTMSRAVGARPGEIIELDRSHDDPVELYVNGRAFAAGTLVRMDDGDWGLRIDSLVRPAARRDDGDLLHG